MIAAGMPEGLAVYIAVCAAVAAFGLGIMGFFMVATYFKEPTSWR